MFPKMSVQTILTLSCWNRRLYWSPMVLTPVSDSLKNLGSITESNKDGSVLKFICILFVLLPWQHCSEKRDLKGHYQMPAFISILHGILQYPHCQSPYDIPRSYASYPANTVKIIWFMYALLLKNICCNISPNKALQAHITCDKHFEEPSTGHICYLTTSIHSTNNWRAEEWTNMNTITQNSLSNPDYLIDNN